MAGQYEDLLRARRLKLDPLLIFLGAGSLVGCLLASFGLRGSGQAEDIIAFLGLLSAQFLLYGLAISRCHARPGVAVQILFWALLFRLALLPAGLRPATWAQDLVADLRSEAVTYRTFLLYDNDVWRYLWDGHVSAAGLDPYADPPSTIEELADDGDPRFEPLLEDELWQDVFDNVSYQDYRTVYPPAAQLFFRTLHGIAPGSVFVYKLALALIDFATCCLLVSILRRWSRPEMVVVYAWNPLLLKEIAGSGHVDGLVIFFLVAAVFAIQKGFRRSALVAFATAILVKLTPVFLIGLFLRRSRPREWVLVPLVLAAAWLPFWKSLPAILSGLRAFAQEWVFNPGPWALVHWIATTVLGFEGRAAADLFAVVATLSLAAWTTWRDDGSGQHLLSGAFVILAGCVIFSATVMPWYLLWALPFAAQPLRFSWLAFTWLSLLSYLVYIDQLSHPWWLWAEFLGFAMLLAFELWRRKASGAVSASVAVSST